MNISHSLACLSAIIGLLCSANANTILHDDFNDNTLDSTKWTTALPQGGSSVVEGGGFVTTTARGILATTNGFVAPYTVLGAFTMLNDLEHFNIALRTDLSSGGAGSYYERAGVVISFSNDGDGISLSQYTNPMTNWAQLATTGQNGFMLRTGEAYYFSITDTGSNVSLAINGVDVLSADTTFSTGDQVAFYSREFGNTATKLDFVTINSVPEAGITSLYLALGLIGVFVLKQRKLVAA